MRWPKSNANTGLSILRYASGFACISEESFSIESFDADGHSNIISSHDQFSYNEVEIKRLRQDCLRLVCGVFEKYCTVRSKSAEKCEFSDCSQKCCSNGGHESDEESVSTKSSSDSSSMLSENSGSIYMPEDDDIEPDKTDHLYGDSAANLNNSYCSECTNHAGDDDSSIEECYSDYKKSGGTRCRSSVTSNDDDSACAAKVVCPGDIVEYRDIQSGGPAKRDSIVTIEDSTKATYIVLKSGVILRPKTHVIRKVKVYCDATENLIPNPLAKWLDVDKCYLQSGSLQSIDNDEPDDSDVEDVEQNHLR